MKKLCLLSWFKLLPEGCFNFGRRYEFAAVLSLPNSQKQRPTHEMKALRIYWSCCSSQSWRYRRPLAAGWIAGWCLWRAARKQRQWAVSYVTDRLYSRYRYRTLSHQRWKAGMYVSGTFHSNINTHTQMHIYRQTHKMSGGHYLSSEPAARQKHMSFKLIQQTNLLLLPLLYTEVEWKSFLGIFFFFVILNLVSMKGEKN